jgi:predicted nucleic acid-binding protein
MLIALDSNVIAYAEGIGDAGRCQKASSIVQSLPPQSILIPTQSLLELLYVLKRKGRKSPEDAQKIVQRWINTNRTANSTATSLQTAIEIATAHDFQVFDAFILAVASENHCQILLSEDMQHGFKWHNVTVVSPFADPIHPLLKPYMEVTPS